MHLLTKDQNQFALELKLTHHFYRGGPVLPGQELIFRNIHVALRPENWIQQELSRCM